MAEIPPHPLSHSPEAAARGERRATHVRWLIFALACATSWLLYVHRYAWGVIRPTLKQENPGLTDFQLGWLDSAFNITYAIGQVPGGLLGDMFGQRLFLVVIILLWSGSLAALTLANGFWPVANVRAMFGLTQAGCYPTLTQVTRRWFPLTSRTTVQGAVASLSGRAGGACASLLVATLLMGSLGLSWQAALLVLSALGVLLALAVWLLFRDSPRDHPWSNAEEQELVGDTSPSAGPAPRLDLRGRTLVTFVALLSYAFASTFADQLYVFWIPQFLEEGKGLSKSAMGVYASLPLLGGALGGFAGGALNDWLIRLTGSRRWGRSLVAFTGKSLAAALLTASLFVEDGRRVMVVLFVCKFFCDWSLPTIWGTVTDISGRAAGTIFGIANTSGAIASFVAGPVLGWLKQEHGWTGLFACVAAMYLAAAMCWLAIDCTNRLWREESS